MELIILNLSYQIKSLSQNFPTIPHMNEIDLGDSKDDVW